MKILPGDVITILCFSNQIEPEKNSISVTAELAGIKFNIFKKRIFLFANL